MSALKIAAVMALTFVASQSLPGQAKMTGIVVFSEPGFPAADSSGASPQQLAAAFAGAQFADADGLQSALTASSARLLVLPYGSAFPEEAWPAIKQFLDRGGNLLVFGGMPFTRAAYRDPSASPTGKWHLRDYSVRFIRPLMIDQYQETPGSDDYEFQPNPEIPLKIPSLAWKRAFSPVIRLSAVDLYKRGGTAGAAHDQIGSERVLVYLGFAKFL